MRRAQVVYGTLPGAQRHTAHPVGLVFLGRRIHSSLTTLVMGTPETPLRTQFVAHFDGGLVMIAVLFPLLAGVVVLRIVGVPLAITGVFFLIAILVTQVVGIRSRYEPATGIALFPEGVFLRDRSGWAWVRWADLAEVREHATATDDARIELIGSSPEAIVVTRVNQWPPWTGGHWSSGNVSYFGTHLRADPRLVVREIRRFHDNPESRRRLGDPMTALTLGTDTPSSAPSLADSGPDTVNAPSDTASDGHDGPGESPVHPEMRQHGATPPVRDEPAHDDDPAERRTPREDEPTAVVELVAHLILDGQAEEGNQVLDKVLASDPSTARFVVESVSERLREAGQQEVARLWQRYWQQRVAER